MNAFSIEKYANDGWYLIDASLPSGCSTLHVSAALKFGDRDLHIPLPASFKGRVFELIPRPAEPHQLTLAAQNEMGELVVDQFKISQVSRLVAFYWAWHRIFGALPALGKQKAKRLGLSWLQAFLHPFATARHLSSLRYHFPAIEYSQWRNLYWFYNSSVHTRMAKHLKKTGAVKLPLHILVDDRLCKCGVPVQFTDLAESPLYNVVEVSCISDKDTDWLPSNLDGWVLFMQPQQQLEPWALAWFLVEAVQHPEAVLIYSDHADLDQEGKPVNPSFKPDWSPEFQKVTHYVGDVLLVKASVLHSVSTTLDYVPNAYELALEVGMQATEQQIRHISAVLWHQLVEKSEAQAEQLKAHLQRHALAAEIEQDQRGHLRVRYTLPASLPKISIVIPTRDMLHFLQPCVDSILQKTTWSNYEILILDNQSSCAETLAYLQSVSADARVRVLRYDQPFNFSAINNFAVEQAAGELVCLLNNDTQVISPDWLEEMASRLLQPGVGAVGARLYFADGRVQHAGDVLGPGGCANHLHGIIAADDPGYMNRAVLPQELSAVTAACLLTHRALYQQLGGLDEHNLTVAFNDVDFCLRIREAGYRVVYTPYAELYHYESVSRGKDDNPVKQARSKLEVQYMRKRWADVIERDPFYNPNLSYTKPDFSLGKYPRLDWPW